MFKRVGIALLAGLVLGGTAKAADLAVKAPPMAPPLPVINWTGFYLGGNVGGLWGRTTGFQAPGGPDLHIHTSGVIGGLQGGYDFELPNNFVLGVRLAAPLFGGTSGTTTDPLVPTLSYKARVLWAAAGTGQVGYAIGPWLPYLGGGVVVGDGKATISSPGFVASDTQTHVGATGLAGVRYWISRNWWVALQYNYTDMGKQTYTFAPGLTRNVGFQSSSLVGMFAYHF